MIRPEEFAEAVRTLSKVFGNVRNPNLFYRRLAGTKNDTVVFFCVCFHLVRLLFLHVLTRLNSVPFSTSSCSSFAEILSQPTNEKYRSLRKDNAVVKVPTRE